MSSEEFILKSISPIDGRYRSKTSELSDYFSEYALIKYRVYIEVKYFLELSNYPIKNLDSLSEKNRSDIKKIYDNFDINDAKQIKKIESEINHDVKAVEYFIKEKFDNLNLSKYKEFIHFGLTSQDINNTAIPLMIKDSFNNVISKSYNILIEDLNKVSMKTVNIPMIARTHGQPATPTTFGKEIKVYESRLKNQIESLSRIPNNGKFGGASGNLNAHYAAFPQIDWDDFSDKFLMKIGLERSKPTTQIEHYDNMASIFHNLSRINTILIDLCRDIWHYISINYLIQKVNSKEVGSSAMPHKVNPIDFENAEGNLMIANSQLIFLAEKLPISRLQRDLTDSTVSRNIGIPISHIKIGIDSILNGLDKVDINEKIISSDLNNNWAVVSEAIQTVLRRENVENPYELLKDLTRGNKEIDQNKIKEFIKNLPIKDSVKDELLLISPDNYLGNLK
jgi:adenylosuccinate lyase|tara:strand:- start:4379 stop:5731 length:1353 start_codon:yes stop_codon:yes gene_type:complete